MKIIGLSVCLLAALASHAQVGIGTTTPDNSAVLHLNSTSKGILVPKMTSMQRNNINSPANGLMVYDTDVNQFYFYNGSAWVQAIGPTGANGKTILNGTTNPGSGIGTNGDFYLNTNTGDIFGPKAGGVWPAGVSIIGPAGSDGTNGTNGIDGKTILNGTTVPAAGLGTNGDFYLRTTNNQLYGPKTAGAWGAGVSLTGPQGVQGPAGPSGIANNIPILYANASGLIVQNSTQWTAGPSVAVTIGTGGALVNVTVSVRSDSEDSLAVGCNICYSTLLAGPWTPIIAPGGSSDMVTAQLSFAVIRTVTLTGKVTPPVGTWWIGPCFISPSENIRVYGVMGYVLIPD